MFEKVGEKIDVGVEKIKEKTEDVKKKTASSVVNTEKSIRKKLNKEFSKKSVSDKLSNFETAAANFAISVANVIERKYKKISSRLFCDQKELKTKYGTLGFLNNRHKVFKVEAETCLNYVKEVEKKIPSQLKLKKDVLKDVVATLSSSNASLFGYYLYGYISKKHIPDKIEEKKTIVKKYLLTKKEKKDYDIKKEGSKLRKKKKQRKH